MSSPANAIEKPYTGGIRVTIESVSITFGNGAILNSFTLAADPGEKIVLTGPSGCGKSSLLGCMLGFVRPAKGTVTIDNTPVSGDTIWELRKNIGFVPQEPLLGDGIVREWIYEQFGFAANREVRQNLAQLDSQFERFNLPGSVLDQQVSELSGGEKQRVTLATVLLLDRPLLLLDEPTSALDPAARDQVYGHLGELSDTTVIMVSHDHASAGLVADRIVRIGSSERKTPHGRD